MKLQIAEIDDAKEISQALQEIECDSDLSQLTRTFQRDARERLNAWMRSLRTRSYIDIREYLNAGQPWPVIELCNCIQQLVAIDEVDPSLRNDLGALMGNIQKLQRARGILNELMMKPFTEYYRSAREVYTALKSTANDSYLDATRFREETLEKYNKATNIFSTPAVRALRIILVIVLVTSIAAITALYILAPSGQESFTLDDVQNSGLRVDYQVPRFVAPGQTDVIRFGVTNLNQEAADLFVTLNTTPSVPLAPTQNVAHRITLEANETQWVDHFFTPSPSSRNWSDLELAFVLTENDSVPSPSDGFGKTVLNASDKVPIKPWPYKQFKDWFDLPARITVILSALIIIVIEGLTRLLTGKSRWNTLDL